MATPATVARKPQNHRGRLGALRIMECQGKSKFFLEHQAMRLKEGDKGYDANVHSWRFAEQLPMPEGKWPLSKFPKPVLDEHDKEEKARQNREEKKLLDEELHRHQRIKEEMQRRRKQFGPGKAPSDKQLWKEIVREDRLARAEERHIGNVQMALRVINRKYPDSKYELREITDKSTIYELGSAYCHYNFTAYSPTDGCNFYFAEVDINPESEHQVYQCCTLGSGPYGCCMGSVNQGVALIHPSSDMFIAGHESSIGFCTDSDSDDDY